MKKWIENNYRLGMGLLMLIETATVVGIFILSLLDYLK
jgi:hypothetical protein